MSTPILNLVDDAAAAIGDPNKERVDLAHWLSIYNRANRELCSKANILRYQDTFDLVAGQKRYDYPEQMVQMAGLEVSDGDLDTTTVPPSRPEATFRGLGEIFEDEFRAITSGNYPTATLPTAYFATSTWYNLVPAAETDMEAAACITYFGLPDRITDIGDIMQVDDFAQDYLIRRMIAFGLRSVNRYVEAAEELKQWEADMMELNDKLADRSTDRRGSLAPRRNAFARMR